MSVNYAPGERLFAGTQVAADLLSLGIIDAVDQTTHLVSGRYTNMARTFDDAILLMPGGLEWGNSMLPKVGDLCFIQVLASDTAVVTPVSTQYGLALRAKNEQVPENTGFRRLNAGEIHSHSIGQAQAFWDDSGNASYFDSAGSGMSFISAEGVIREEAVMLFEKFANGAALTVGAVRKQVAGNGQYIEAADGQSTPTQWNFKMVPSQAVGSEALSFVEQVGDITDATDVISTLIRKMELLNSGVKFTETVDRSGAYVVDNVGGTLSMGVDAFTYTHKASGATITISSSGDITVNTAQNINYTAGGNVNITGSEVVNNNGDKGVARLDDGILIDASTSPALFAWMQAVNIALLTSPTVPLDGGTTYKAGIAAILGAVPIPTEAIGIISEASATVKAGD